jgi:Fe-S cluster biogenesis protein NfuA/nitrite reductase/ring-hydroxylating ferredoxin subunit
MTHAPHDTGDTGVPPADHDAAPDLSSTGERIDALIEALATAPPQQHGGRARERAEELVRVVTDLYGAGLERLLEIVYDSGRLDEELLELLARDDLVASLLLVHGLHPYDVATRVERALEDVRPYLGSHGGDVELVEITDAGAVHLRLLGSCDGCPSSSVTLELAVQDAIESAAPEILAIEVDAPSSHDADPTPALIPVESLRTRLETRGTEPSADGGATWHPVDGAAALASGQGTTLVVGGVELYACRVGHEHFVFRDGCARCGHTLAGTLPVRRLGGGANDAVLTCPGCAAHYDVRRAGACLDDPALHLSPLPALVEGGVVSVALPAAVLGAVGS